VSYSSRYKIAHHITVYIYKKINFCAPDEIRNILYLSSLVSETDKKKNKIIERFHSVNINTRLLCVIMLKSQQCSFPASPGTVDSEGVRRSSIEKELKNPGKKWLLKKDKETKSFFYIFFGGIFFFLLVQYSALLHLPLLRFHCADGCWDRTQDRCNWCIGSQTL
jgi:hypothetical protein